MGRETCKDREKKKKTDSLTVVTTPKKKRAILKALYPVRPLPNSLNKK